MQYRNTQQTGFTLVEILVAVAVFAVFSVMVYGGLSAVMRARVQTDQVAKDLSQLQMVFLRFKRDIVQAVNRPVRGSYGNTESAFTSNDFGAVRLVFTRTGYPNPAGLARSDLLRVAYGVEDKVLYRIHWPVLDQAEDSQPLRLKMLEGVEDVELQFVDDKGERVTDWPPVNNTAANPGLPRAVELTIIHTHWGRVTRLITLAEGVS